jgi:thiamine biosynthesis lipoprotein ApbE
MIAVDAVRHVEHVMGTAVSFDVRTTDGDERHARQLIANACAVLHADDRTFSPWREDSAVSRVQRGELALWDAPADTARIRFAVEPPGAVATSGSYERGPHIYDPFGGGAGDAAASATVTGPELDLADALATALIVAGTPGLELVDRIDATEACLVLADGTLRATRGFPFAT